MMNPFEHIKFRPLKKVESDFSNIDCKSMLVIESETGQSSEELILSIEKGLIKDISTVSEHGAILLRNFDIRSEKEFEKCISSIKNVRGMSNYFMAEHGRVLVEHTKFVFYTNKFIKTGGTLQLGGFHSENYYTTDVPKYISFCCLQPSNKGGETGLVDMRKVYNDLPERLKEKINSKTFWINSFDVSDIETSYNISKKQVEEACVNHGLTLDTTNKHREAVLLFKPHAIIHPETRETTLLCNICAEVSGLNVALRKEFLDDYSGIGWWWHRLLWQNPTLFYISNIKWKKLPKILLSSIKNRIKQKSKDPQSEPADLPSFDRIGNVFHGEDVTLLAKLMRKHFITFRWQKGDILLIDNLLFAHAGMPGFGSRNLKTIISNPVLMKYKINDPGKQEIFENADHRTLADTIDHYNN